MSRLLPDGALDPSFGVAGTTLISSLVGGDPLQPVSAAVQNDDRILVAANDGLGAEHLLRLGPNGGLDATFGNAGRTVVDLPGYEMVRVVAAAPGGGIFVGGALAGVAPPSFYQALVVRYTGDLLAAPPVGPATKPVIEITSPWAGWTTRASRLMRFQISGAARATASFRGRPLPFSNNTIDPRRLVEGRGRLVVTAYNAAGDSTVWSQRLTVDRTAPVVVGAPRYTLGPSLRVRVSDNLSGVTKQHVTLNVPWLGRNVIPLELRDRVRNRATRKVSVQRRIALSMPSLNTGLSADGNPLVADAVRRAFDRMAQHPWQPPGGLSTVLAREVQWRLRELGYLPGAFAPTGTMDAATIRALQRYQGDRGLPRVGVAGPATRLALDQDLLGL